MLEELTSVYQNIIILIDRTFIHLLPERASSLLKIWKLIWHETYCNKENTCKVATRRQFTTKPNFSSIDNDLHAQVRPTRSHCQYTKLILDTESNVSSRTGRVFQTWLILRARGLKYTLAIAFPVYGRFLKNWMKPYYIAFKVFHIFITVDLFWMCICRGPIVEYLFHDVANYYSALSHLYQKLTWKLLCYLQYFLRSWA